MVVKYTNRSPKMSPWAIRVESCLLLLRKDELVDLLRSTGQSVSSLKHRAPEKIRQTLLSLPREDLAMVLRERNRRLQRSWHERDLNPHGGPSAGSYRV